MLGDLLYELLLRSVVNISMKFKIPNMSLSSTVCPKVQYHEIMSADFVFDLEQKPYWRFVFRRMQNMFIRATWFQLSPELNQD